MRSCRLIPLLFLAVAAIALPSQGAPSPAPQNGIRIAIANPTAIFRQIRERAVLNEKLNLKKQSFEAEAKAKADEIRMMIQERDNYNPQHPKWADITKSIDKAQTDFQAWEAFSKLEAEREQKVMLKTLYDKIEAAIAHIAQQQGIDLVIPDTRQEITGKDLEAMNIDNLNHLLTSRSVLYAAKPLDITETVIAVLDQQFSANGGATAPTPAPAPSPARGPAPH